MPEASRCASHLLPTVLLVEDQALTQDASAIDLLLQLRWPNVHALYLSGGAEEWAVMLMRETGAEYLSKPFTAGELRTALAAVLRSDQ